jgi:hypothetical protein
VSVQYCDRWFYAGKRPIDVLDEETARARHEARLPYTAVLGSFDGPTHVISVASPWVSVGFFDSSRREYLNYDFKETDTEPTSLLLSRVEFREFAGDSDEPLTHTQLAFEPNGRLLIERQDVRTGETLERETRDDLAENWEDYPTFGSYESLCRAERLPAVRRVANDRT